ncbi:MarR family winged helix-turn-helix transcriptional regulator [Gottschalkia acidurici]|nr:MarR family transcriptional regulator [Gottschalkia acidurici]
MKIRGLMDGYNWVNEITNKTIIELKKTADILEEAHNNFFYKYDISNTKFNALAILYNGPKEGMILSEIGDQMLVTRGNITGLIDRLEKQKFVKRVRDDEDRRKIVVIITEEGKVFIEKVIEDYKKWTGVILQSIEVDEKNEFIRILKKFKMKL